MRTGGTYRIIIVLFILLITYFLVPSTDAFYDDYGGRRELVSVKAQKCVAHIKNDPSAVPDKGKEFERLPDKKTFTIRTLNTIYTKPDHQHYLLLSYAENIPRSFMGLNEFPHKYFKEKEANSGTVNSLSVSLCTIETGAVVWKIVDFNIDGLEENSDIVTGTSIPNEEYENALDFILSNYE